MKLKNKINNKKKQQIRQANQTLYPESYKWNNLTEDKSKKITKLNSKTTQCWNKGI
jgi:hypothetical protein